MICHQVQCIVYLYCMQTLQRENMALQSLLEAQQRQNELLKQSLQRQQQTTSSYPHTALLETGNMSAPVTVSHLSSFSPTVIAVGGPRAPTAIATPASTIQRPAVFHTADAPVAARELNSQTQFVDPGAGNPASAVQRAPVFHNGQTQLMDSGMVNSTSTMQRPAVFNVSNAPVADRGMTTQAQFLSLIHI